MQKKKICKNNIIFILGLLIIIICISIILFKMIKHQNLVAKEKEGIELFFERQIVNDNEFNVNTSDYKNISPNFDYIAVLEIPKINLKRGLVDIDSIYNSIDFNIQILKESIMPNIDNSNLILVAHSGNSNVSFFKDLDKLEILDNVYLYYNNTVYQYEIYDKYEIEKIGSLKLNKNINSKIITLITCKDSTNKQLVYIGKLKDN
ncbi:MAG: sortase [Bacilli bacterium]|nr:sortase [Bacilli bacterium]